MFCFFLISLQDLDCINLETFAELIFPESVKMKRGISQERKSIKHNPFRESDHQSDTSVPGKFICSKSRTTYLTPTYFTRQHLKLSNAPPRQRISKKFVIGFSWKNLYSGTPLHCLPPSRTNTNHRIIYPAASLGVIHDLTSNTQSYFEGHTDDITCLDVDPSGTYAITGQLGMHRADQYGI
jgi:hypothetical protein